MSIEIMSNVFVDYERAGKGPVVVLLHAFPLCRAMWRPQMTALQGAYDVIAPDFRGFGGSSPADARPSIERMADDVFALLDALKILERVVVVGLSMGGYVALAAARKYAGRLRGLVLADTRAEADDDAARANRDKLIEFARKHSARDVLEQLLPKLLGEWTREKNAQVMDEVRRIASAQPIEGIIAALQALRDRPDASASLASIRVPTLVLVGAGDAITPPPLAEKLQSSIPESKLVKIPNAGHLANLEQPAAFNQALLNFLNTLPTSA